ncbi:MAG: hypothetical protein ACK2T4_00030 [Candidatus Promineifilaceae bacterium]|jgi:hypothetical protein
MDAEDRKKWEELQKRFIKAANEVVNLRITTTVGDVAMVKDAEEAQFQPKVTKSASLYTVVNILQGDMETFIDESLLNEKFDTIRELHKDREEQAHLIIQKNMETLTELAKSVLKLLNENPETPETPENPPE